MKKLFLSILLVNSAFGISQVSESMSTMNLRKQQIENIRNSQIWDMERMKGDITNVNEMFPLHFGAFPVPHYNKLGTYEGGGNATNAYGRSISDYRLIINEKEVVFNSLFLGNSPFYKDKDRNRSFFTILTVIDTVSTKNYAINSSQFLSRNHPDYGGQGSFITKDNRIDYVAFTTPDKGSFAIVNMRLFHLEFGDIIIIAPQKDGSFRSMQIQGEKVEQTAFFAYLKEKVLKRDDVIRFLTNDGVIDSKL